MDKKQIDHEQGVEWPMFFLWAKRTPGDGVINLIF
jgi:hypothetical protein